VRADDAGKIEDLRRRSPDNLALDHTGALVYIAPTRVNLSLTMERWPEVRFEETREHAAA
jgi:peptide chain release factor 3